MQKSAFSLFLIPFIHFDNAPKYIPKMVKSEAAGHDCRPRGTKSLTGMSDTPTQTERAATSLHTACCEPAAVPSFWPQTLTSDPSHQLTFAEDYWKFHTGVKTVTCQSKVSKLNSRVHELCSTIF